MPGHTAAHERASNRKTTTGSYSRSRNQGGVKTTVTSNNNRTRIQNEKQKEFKKTYQANEFSGTGKTTKTKTERDLLRLDNLKIGEVPKGIPGSTILNAFQKARQKNLERNVEYFKGLKSRGKAGQYDLTDEGYKSYMTDRLGGKIDAAGNVNPGYGRDRDNNIQTQKVVGGRTILTETPTEAEVAESEAADSEYDARKTKRRGRRRTILTSQRGASGNLVLGKPTLLGA